MDSVRAYIYAKACGMIAKSFVEDRVNHLAAISSIEAFEALVFGNAGTGVSIEDIEKRLDQREREAVSKVVKPFSRPSKFLQILAESDSPPSPSAKKSGFLSEMPDVRKISRQNSAYYTALWQEMDKIPYSDRKLITKILSDEIRLKNAGWALRLRVYYLMPADQIADFLITVKGGANPVLHHDALKALDLDVQEEAQWHAWRYWKYMNKPVAGKYWKVDPCFFQNQASLYLYHLARKNLRRSPFTLDTACCFIKLKQFEKEILTSIAEATRLGLTGGDALEILGLSGKAA
jgi:hypothetical protein